MSFAEGEFYHVYNRGNSKQAIFTNDADRERFVSLLYVCNSEKRINFRDDITKKNITVWEFDRGAPLVSIGAWVLMPNHFHLYLTPSPQIKHYSPEARSRAGISELMQRISTAYSKYFNTKYGRTGSLFEGKFKSVHVDNDTHAKYLFSYIHLNPIKLYEPAWKKEGFKNKQFALKYLDRYRWSSYLDYKRVQRNEHAILDTKNFPDYFHTPEILEREMFDWLSYEE